MGAAQETLPTRWGPFLLLRLLGAGGMGKAYLARHPDWKSGLVVKRMHAQLLADRTIFKRFVHEAKVATYVRHKNVAQLVAMGTVGTEPFIATEFVFGIPLSRIIQRVEQSKISGVPYEIALKLGIALCDGIEAVHDARDVETGESLNLIHRDVGTRNVLIGFDGRLQVIDLGLGKSILADWQTATDVFAGSPDYMPPEQALGHRVDRRADVYSTAVTIWELIVGRKRINEAGIPARIKRAIEARPEQLVKYRPEASVDLEDAFKRAMAQDPSVRTPTIGLFRDRLQTELTRIGGPVRRADIVSWLDVACATIIAKDRRILEDAEAAAYDVHLPAPNLDNTQYLAAQPILFMAPMSEREDSEVDEPPPLGGLDGFLESSRRIRVRGTAEARHVARNMDRWFATLDRKLQIALVALPPIVALLIVIVVALPAPPEGLSVAPLVLPPPPVVVQPPTPPPIEPAPVPVAPPVVSPSDPSEPSDPADPDDATHDASAHKRVRLPPERLERKRTLVLRIRQLRKQRFDVSWQRRVTTLSTRLSRARTKASLDRIEGQITAMETAD